MRVLASLIVLLSAAATARGAITAPIGINSDGLGLDGFGVLIGMVEGGHPGRDGFDSPTATVPHVNPIGVFVGTSNSQASMDQQLGSIFTTDTSHATQVAAVINGSAASGAIHEGVAPLANLYAAAIPVNDTRGGPLTLNAMAQRTISPPLADADRVRAINISYVSAIQGPVERLDGNTHLTQFIDWSSKEHEVLYVVAWPNLTNSVGAPSDNYNGITVAPTAPPVGPEVVQVATEVAANPLNGFDAVGDRTSIDLLAPGAAIPALNPITDNPIPGGISGSSYATPHVTGAVALLQQFAVQEISFGNPAFDFDRSRRHEVMKAVLLNSADKLNGVQGSSRTVLNRANQDWTNAPVFTREDQPLDRDIGAGMINVERAIEQFRNGEFGPGGVADVGWDLGRSGGVGDSFSYAFDQSAQGGDFISVTLAWDREVTLTGVDDNYNEGDDFFNEGFEDTVNNLNLYLLDANETDVNNAVARSVATDSTVEHIFFEVPAGGGDYKIVVQHDVQGDPFATSDGPPAAIGIDSRTDFAVAWWAYEPTSILRGDYDGNGLIDGADFDVWTQSFGDRVFSGRSADGNLDGVINVADYAVWRNAFAASIVAAQSVPEPSGLLLLVLASIGWRWRVACAPPPTTWLDA